MIRLLVVLAVLVALGAARPLLARSRRRAAAAALPTESLARFAAADTDRTWVVFTTPYCVTCGPVMAELSAAFPDDAVVGVDATAEPELTTQLGVRRSPTVFEIAPDGRVLDRMIGADAARARLPRVEVG